MQVSTLGNVFSKQIKLSKILKESIKLLHYRILLNNCILFSVSFIRKCMFHKIINMYDLFAKVRLFFYSH